jgi:hypothetical protein
MIKKLRIPLVALIVALLFISFFGVNQVFAAETEYEKLDTGQDADSSDIYGVNMTAMQFTSQSTAHTVTKIKVYLMRSGSPGTVTCELREAAAGVPIGEALTYGVASGNSFSAAAYAWITFDLSDEYSLSASTQYAIVISAVNGDAANYVLWGQDAGGGLASAISSDSTDGGSTWVAAATADGLFEIWGNGVLSIESVMAFRGYIEANDLLFVAEIINNYPPYANTENAKDYFQMQLLGTDGVTVLAASPITAWGNKPQSVYLSANAATPITYGGGYYIRIIGTFASPPSVSQILISGNWKDNLLYLDDWVIKTAYNIQTYYGYSGTSALVQYVTQSNEILTDAGGAIFANGIPGIATIRPNIFAVAKSKPLAPTATANNVFDSTSYVAMVGTPIATDLAVFGNVFGISGQNFAGWGIGILIAVATIAGMILGGRAAIAVLVVVGLPLALIGNYTHVLGIQWTLVPVIALFMIFVLRFWWSRT